VAAVIEATRILLEGQPLRSGLLIAFFSGEEEGLIGSSALLAAAGPEQVRVAICVDAVGHLDSTLLLMGLAGQPLLDSVVAASVGALRLSRAPELWAGDHASFLARGIPALGISTGPHALMNTPRDDPSTLDYAGLAAVTRALVDIVRAVDSLNVRLETPTVPELTRPAPRTARFGTMPDFGHTEAGVRVAGVVPGSPAAAAGILPGDDLVSMAGNAIGGPGDLAKVLRGLAPGDTVVVEYRRQGTSATVLVVLDSRR
jgi:membrane-associated protease RseP (regulator of RpoE activity)